VYVLFLEKEKMHRFNRWYLLVSLAFACLIPLVSFDVSEGSLPVLQDNYIEIIVSGYQQPDQTIKVSNTSADYLTPALWIIYLGAAFLLLMRFTRNIYRLLVSAARNRSVIHDGTRLVLLKENITSYSFLNNIFINERDYANRSIEDTLILHELTHVKQKHSWDVIFIELLQLVFWFNPVFILYKKAIQRNHEYLADDAVIKVYGNIPAYQYLLLDKISPGTDNYMASSFSYLSTKNRLVMMTKANNRFITLAKKICLIPVAAGAVFIFSSKNTIAQHTAIVKTIPIKTPARKEKAPYNKGINGLKKLASVPYAKEGLSQEMLNDYKAFEKKFDTVDFNRHNFPAILDDEKFRMEALYKKMNREQQLACRVFFTPPLGPSIPDPPTDEQLKRWGKNKIYGVFIGDERIENSELGNYKTSDFPSYGLGLKLSPEKQKEYKYVYQVILTTVASFKKYNERRRADKHFEMVYAVERAPTTR
jgi:bla regulator protein BlaR1